MTMSHIGYTLSLSLGYDLCSDEVVPVSHALINVNVLASFLHHTVQDSDRLAIAAAIDLVAVFVVGV